MRWILTLLVAAHSAIDVGRERSKEDGSVTIEHVIWAVAFIAIAGVVVAAITAYVTAQAGNIR